MSEMPFPPTLENMRAMLVAGRNELKKMSQRARRKRLKRLGIVSIPLILAWPGFAWLASLVSESHKGISDHLSGLSVEMIGALLTFWLIEVVWQWGEKEHDNEVQKQHHLRMMTFHLEKIIAINEEGEKQGFTQADVERLEALNRDMEYEKSQLRILSVDNDKTL